MIQETQILLGKESYQSLKKVTGRSPKSLTNKEEGEYKTIRSEKQYLIDENHSSCKQQSVFLQAQKESIPEGTQREKIPNLGSESKCEK